MPKTYDEDDEQRWAEMSYNNETTNHFEDTEPEEDFEDDEFSDFDY